MRSLRIGLVLLIIIALSSCGIANLTHIQGSTEVSGFDFRPYASDGFLLTQSEYLGDYITLGILKITVTPEASLGVAYISGTGNPISSRWDVSYEGFKEQALEEVYQICIDMGADALVNMTIELVPVSYIDRTSPALVLYSYEITGAAIKRL